jgi:hypothetical protein
VPQLPQLALSLAVTTQLLPHSMEPLGQLVVQVPLWHCCPAAQALPHEPQLAGSTVTAVQVEPHFMKGVGHDGPELVLLVGQAASNRTKIDKRMVRQHAPPYLY